MKLTKEILEQHILKKDYIRMWHKITVCIITLDNGYEVIGSSACINPEDYDLELGKKFAYEDAFEKLWSLFGFLANYWQEFFDRV